MPRTKTIDGQMASASFAVQWEEAIAFHRELSRMRSQLKETHGVGNLQMRFIYPWGGPSHTEFRLTVQLARGAAVAPATISKWLLDTGKDFLKEHRKKQKNTHVKPKARATRRGQETRNQTDS